MRMDFVKKTLGIAMAIMLFGFAPGWRSAGQTGRQYANFA